MDGFLDIERETYRTRYSTELDRRSQINDRTDAQIQLFSLFVGLVVYSVLNIPAVTSLWAQIWFWVSVVILITGTFVGLGLVTSAILRDKIVHLPNPLDTHKECQDLLAWHVKRDAAGGAVATENEMTDRLDTSYLHAAQTNAQINDGRDMLLRKSKYCVLIALVGFLLMAVPYIEVVRIPPGANTNGK